MLDFKPFLRFAAVMALAVTASVAAADVYPDKPVRIVVGFPAGQGTDVIARIAAQQLSASTGQQFFVDNKPGAAGIIGTDFVKNSKPDGYTLLFTSSGPMAINPSLYKNLAYDPVKDFTPVGVASIVPLLLAVSTEVPANSVSEFVGYVKANPGKFTYGSGGNGVTAHLAMELLKGASGMDLRHVPYKGSPAAVTDLVAGRVQAMFDSPLVLLPYAKAGRIKILGVATRQRIQSAPTMPTIAEQGFNDFEAVTWVAMFAPAGTPKAVVDKLNAELNKALRLPSVSAALANVGAEPSTSTSEELGATLRGDIAKWAKAVKASGLQID